MEETKPISCALEGASARCRVFKEAGGGPHGAWFVRANVRGQPLAVLCLTNDRNRTVPAACASVLSLKPPAREP